MMIHLQKLVVGIQPSNKLFRLFSLGPILVDKLMELRGKKPIDDNYFSSIHRSHDTGTIKLNNDDESSALVLDMNNIIFEKNHYQVNKKINIDHFQDEISALWRLINEELRIKDIRRIGIAGEYRFEVKGDTASKILLDQYTKFNLRNSHPAKAHIRFEERKLTKDGGIPDPKKGDFLNIIRDYYDSEIDIDYSEQAHINANLDVQRYYSPLFNGDAFSEVKILFRTYDQERKILSEDIKSKGLAND